MEYATKTELIEAVFSAVLKRAASNFPARGYISAEAIAKDIDVQFKVEDRPAYGRRVVFPEMFGVKLDSLVRNTVLWLVESEYLYADPANPAELATLSERGVRMLDILPKCLLD